MITHRAPRVFGEDVRAAGEQKHNYDEIQGTRETQATMMTHHAPGVFGEEARAAGKNNNYDGRQGIREMQAPMDVRFSRRAWCATLNGEVTD